MYCKFCGAEVKDGADVCLSCGRYVNDKPQSAQVVSSNDRNAYLLLAIFLGAFGAHNFYVGRTDVGIVQLLISVLSCFILCLPVSIWAIVEACINLQNPDFLRK